jgi:nucleoside-diphosphate-sugar epimerase
VLLASSCEIHGEAAVLPVSESDPVAPINLYGRSKAAAEQLMMAARANGQVTQIARFAKVYGSIADHPDRVVPAFARAAATGGVMHVRGCANAFDFTHVDDVAQGVSRLVVALLAGERDLPPLQFASGRPASARSPAWPAASVGGQAGEGGRRALRGRYRRRFWGDPTRAWELLGWQATIDIETGLGRLLAVFLPLVLIERSHGAWVATLPPLALVVVWPLADTFPISFFLERLGEFAHPQASGSMRFFGP